MGFVSVIIVSGLFALGAGGGAAVSSMSAARQAVEAKRWLCGPASVPMPMGGRPDGAGPRGLSPVRSVSEDDRPNHRDEHRKSDAQDEDGDGAEPAAATFLILLLTVPATSLLR